MVLKDVDLARLRIINQKSQEEVAKALGICLTSYRNKESGDNDVWFKEGYKLASVYGCTFDEVFQAMLLTQKKAKQRKARKRK